MAGSVAAVWRLELVVADMIVTDEWSLASVNSCSVDGELSGNRSN